jgi:hypothetical protein
MSWITSILAARNDESFEHTYKSRGALLVINQKDVLVRLKVAASV